jgi:hypothetical protein
MLIVVAIALGLWTVAGIFGFSEGLHYWKLSRHTDQTGTVIESTIRFVLGFFLIVIGVELLDQVLPSTKTLLLVLASVFLLLSRWVWKRRKRRWSELASGRHQREAVLTYVGMIAFPLLAVVFLVLLF